MASKGIRVNQLAKELGVESKAILTKLRDEGLGDKAPNHMSVLPLGLAESVREWFTHLGGGTAVETAAPVAVDVKPKRSRTSAKKKAGGDGEHDEANGGGDSNVATAEAPDEAAAATTGDEREARPSRAGVTPVMREAPADTADADTEVPAPAAAPESPTPVAPSPALPAAAEAPPRPTAAPAARPQVHMPATAAPTAPTSRPTTAPGGPHTHRPAATAAPGVAGPGARPAPGAAVPNRPTVTIGPSRGAGSGPAVVERRAVQVAPQLDRSKLQPAQMKGPSVVRVEKPDNLPTPRARPRPGEGPGGAPGGPTVFRPRTGAGVKVTTTEDDDEEAKKKAAAKARGSLSGRRRGGIDGRRGEAMEKLKEYTEADLAELRERLGQAGHARSAFDAHLKQAARRGQHVQAKTGVQRGEPIEVEEPITVKSLSAVLGVKATDIVRKLFLQGVHGININSNLDTDAAEAIALEYGVELHVRQQETLEEQLLAEFNSRPVDEAALQPRPPVVTILGHVDHGKTSLLDKIRNANVAAGESGGITQHTAAWMVELERNGTKKRVTFIDTPGHQAFTSMRARGANMTDVVVLVVAAVEGVMPQTIESINHARAAGVPIVVALNKIDRPDANPDMVLGQLAAQGLNPTEWGGDTEVVRTSAVTGQGIEDLIDILDYQAELLNLRADPNSPARGAVIESNRDPGLGPVATVLVQNGTLKVGDVILSGPGYGRIRSLLNDRMQMIQEAGPSTPVIVSGLNELPGAGDKFFTVDDFDRARSIAEERQLLSRQTQLSNRTQVSLANLNERIKEGGIKTINLIIKGDVQGSVETLAKTVTDQNTEEVRVRVIHAAVGGITESDVELADASSAVIIGFHVVPDEAARAMAEQRHVEVRLYRVIYEIFDDLKKALSGMLEPEIREKLHGHVEVRQVFKVSRLGNIAGCMVTDGHVLRGSKIRLIRDGRVVTEELAIESLKRVKEDVREVKAGFECGIKLAGYDDIKVGDVLEAYIREEFQRTL